MTEQTSRDTWESHVLPHGPLTQIAGELWCATGSLKRGVMPRNMLVYRIRGGGLLIHSAIALNEVEQQKLEALGQPEVIIVPNGMHRMDAGVYKDRYPKLRVLCPRGSRKKVEEVIKVDATVEDAFPFPGVSYKAIEGIKPIELCYELEIAAGGKALVFNDALMNMEHLPGFGGWILKQVGSTGSFGMTAIGRLLLLKDKAAFKRWLEKQSLDPSVKIVGMSHGKIITENAPVMLKAAADRL